METEREIIDESKIKKELIDLLMLKGFTPYQLENSDKPLDGVYRYEYEGLVYHVSINSRSYDVFDSTKMQFLYSFDGELYDEYDDYIGMASLDKLLYAIKETPAFHRYYVQPEPYTCWLSDHSLPPDGKVEKISTLEITFSK